jgi:hypothetical protein
MGVGVPWQEHRCIFLIKGEFNRGSILVLGTENSSTAFKFIEY